MLLQAVLKTSVMVVIDASRLSFLQYKGGVYSDAFCRPDSLDHALQLVGYGTEGGVDYWICKNSWGKYVIYMTLKQYA